MWWTTVPWRGERRVAHRLRTRAGIMDLFMGRTGPGPGRVLTGACAWSPCELWRWSEPRVIAMRIAGGGHAEGEVNTTG